MNKIRKYHGVPRLALLMVLLIFLLHIEPPGLLNLASAQGPCGDTYIVLPEDTIEEIADLCGVTVDAILRINPEITDPENLYPGQIIRIPDAESILETIVAISPVCGLPGQSILVVGSGFPVDRFVELRLAEKDKDSTVIGGTNSDQFGMIDTSIILPTTAQPGSIWVVIGEAQVSSARFIGISNEFSVIQQARNPNTATTYIVQVDDTLRSIAVKFNRDPEAILLANPQITETNQINPGQIIRIPPKEPGTPITKINPICGQMGTEVLVTGSGFPPVTTVNLGMGQYLVSYEEAGTTTSSPNRTITTRMNIASSGQIGELWVVVAGTSTFPRVQSTSNIFTVTPPIDVKAPQLYISKPGDTLNEIAAEYKRTVAAILSVNPQISNPNQLTIGEKIIIPGQMETILITPVSGPPLTQIQVGGLGFPPLSTVILGLARGTTIFSIEGPVPTDVNGLFTTEYLIPNSRPGEKWSVVAIQTDDIDGEVTARSNEFTITLPQPPLQSRISLWPLEGPAGTSLSIVGSNFPSYAEIKYSFGESGATPFLVDTTWTEINGTFALDLIVPLSAEVGESWTITAEVVNDPQTQASSHDFLVVEP
ncbi:MAG: LysM peptidoglycan-binding domain-containing protein [Anaerolineales bacterium]